MADPKIWVFVETEEGKPRGICLELLSKARELGTAEAVILTPEADAALPILSEYGASRVFVHRDAAYAEHPILPAVDTLSALVEQHRPQLLLFGTTYYSRDVASRLAARLDSGAITDAIDLTLKDETLEVTVSALGGSYLVTSTLVGSATKIVLVRPKAFEARAVDDGDGCRAGAVGERPDRRAGACPLPPTVEEVDVSIRDEARRVRVVETVVESGSGPELEDALFVAAGGRGMRDAKHFQMLHELADLFGGAVGASRVAVDLGWAPYSYQVGQTGKTVKPLVYVACGISGSFQHMAGMSGSKTIIAINKDPEAQIFKIADFGVVGDVFTVLPQLIEEIARRKGAGQT